MTLTPGLFRRLIWTAFGLHVVAGLIDRMLPTQIPDVLREANLKLVEEAATSSSAIPLAAVSLIFLIAGIASLVGLYRFKSWGRTLSVVLFVAGIVLSIGIPSPYCYSLSSASADSIATLATALDGAILAMAYFASPISSIFDGETVAT